MLAASWSALKCWTERYTTTGPAQKSTVQRGSPSENERPFTADLEDRGPGSSPKQKHSVKKRPPVPVHDMCTRHSRKRKSATGPATAAVRPYKRNKAAVDQAARRERTSLRSQPLTKASKSLNRLVPARQQQGTPRKVQQTEKHTARPTSPTGPSKPARASSRSSAAGKAAAMLANSTAHRRKSGTQAQQAPAKRSPAKVR